MKNNFYKPNKDKNEIKNEINKANLHFENIDDKVKNIQKMVRGHSVRKKNIIPDLRKEKKINLSNILP